MHAAAREMEAPPAAGSQCYTRIRECSNQACSLLLLCLRDHARCCARDGGTSSSRLAVLYASVSAASHACMPALYAVLSTLLAALPPLLAVLFSLLTVLPARLALPPPLLATLPTTFRLLTLLLLLLLLFLLLLNIPAGTATRLFCALELLCVP